MKPSELRLIAVDPGYTTGMAMRVEGKLYTCVTHSPAETLALLKGSQLVIVERFVTSGTLSAPGLHTIELGAQCIGYAKALGIKTKYEIPSARYSHMLTAKSLVGSLITPSPWAKHEVDALAHLLAWEYRNAR